MKYFLLISSLSLSFALYGSAQDDYDTITDNANDCHQEHELGEFDYPDIVALYKECKNAPLLAQKIKRSN